MAEGIGSVTNGSQSVSIGERYARHASVDKYVWRLARSSVLAMRRWASDSGL
jgi:hypothetical protein